MDKVPELKYSSPAIIETHFYDCLKDQEFFGLFQLLIEEGFVLYLVGGAIRDFIQTGQLVRDLDLEVHLPNVSSLEEAFVKLKRLLDQKDIDYESLNFKITRFHLDGHEIEIGFPRTETYSSEKVGKAFKHDEFSVSLFSQLDLEESFKRRDLSINAIAIQIKKESCAFFDPFAGLKDFSMGKLANCSDDFFLDPVRFLRLIRFKLRFNMEFSEELNQKLSAFNLELCTDHYLHSEFKKSGKNSFLKQLFEVLDSNKIRFPKQWNVMRYFQETAFNGVERELYNFWLSYKDEQEQLQAANDLLKLKSSLFKKFTTINDALELKSAPKLVSGHTLKEEDILALKRLKVLCDSVELIEQQGIPVFDILWIKNFSNKLKTLKIPVDEYEGVENSQKWTIPLLKALSISS